MTAIDSTSMPNSVESRQTTRTGTKVRGKFPRSNSKIMMARRGLEMVLKTDYPGKKKKPK